MLTLISKMQLRAYLQLVFVILSAMTEVACSSDLGGTGNADDPGRDKDDDGVESGDSDDEESGDEAGKENDSRESDGNDDIGSDTDADSDSDADGNSDAHGDSDADGDTDTDTDSDSDTDMAPWTISASDNFTAQPIPDRTVLYGISEAGEHKPITWGLDLAWLSETNIRRGIAFMGSDRVDVVRSSFIPTDPLVGGRLTGDSLARTHERLDIIKENLGSNTQVVLNCDHPSVHPFFKGN